MTGIKLPPFYLDDAEQGGPHDAFVASLAVLGASALELNSIKMFTIDPLFEVLLVGHDWLALPKANFATIAIPGLLDDHAHMEVDRLTVQEIVESRINGTFRRPMWIFSANRAFGYVMQMNYFSYSIFKRIRAGFHTDSFIVTDEAQIEQLCYHDDLEITLFASRHQKINELSLGGKSVDFWAQQFNEKFAESIAAYQSHLDLINKYYVPRLPGIKCQEFPPGTEILDSH